MNRHSSRQIGINDIREWDANDVLNLSPKFQRRSVWSDKARSYLIDTILRDLPIPKLYLRQEIDDSGRTIREVVDGQQRIRTILLYLRNGFRVMHVHGGEDFGGKCFDELDQDIKDDFLNYEIACDLLIGASDPDVLDIFARLNTYGVRLNTQELLNAKYFGEFKSIAYQLGYEFNSFWLENRILSEHNITRMLEAELVSELIIAILGGIQSRKVVEQFYQNYDDEFPDKRLIIDRFRENMDIIGAIMRRNLPSSNFSSKHLFYSLFCAIYDLKFGLPESSTELIVFNSQTTPIIQRTLEDIDYILGLPTAEIMAADREFYDASTRHTTDLTARQVRHHYLINRIVSQLGTC